MPKLTISERKKALQNQLAKIEKEEQAQTDKKHKIIGRIVENSCNEDATLKAKISELMAKQLTNNAERKIFGLPPLATKRGRPISSNTE